MYHFLLTSKEMEKEAKTRETKRFGQEPQHVGDDLAETVHHRVPARGFHTQLDEGPETP